MLTEKRKQLRLANIVTCWLFALISLIAYFLPLNGNNVLALEFKYSNLVSGPAFQWYLFFLTLIALGLFTWFQSRKKSLRNHIIPKTLDTLGWTAPASFILYSLGIVLWHFELLLPALFIFIILALVLFIANSNIRDQQDVFDEKFWVRNPFSFFIGWTLLMIMTTIAMRWQAIFSEELPAVILLTVFMGLVLLFAFVNRNIGVPFLWLIILIFKQIQFVDSYLFRMVAWAGIAAMIFMIVLLFRLAPKTHLYRKPVNHKMDKYNYGQDSAIEKLENELNDKLQTKPGGRITFR